MIVRFPFAAIAASLLAGCASHGPFPSLAPRPAEAIDMSVEPVREAPAVARDEALRARTAELVAALESGDRRFEADYPVAGRAVRGAGPQGSESWVEAQQAISRLEAARAQTMAALADLNQLRLERADLPTNEQDQAAIDAAIELGERIAAGQQARIDRLRRD